MLFTLRQTTLLPLSALLMLGGCMHVPRPFSDPGAKARQLAANAPPSRLDVPQPEHTDLSPANSALLSQDIAEALLQQTIPAIAQPTRKGDWWLKVTTEQRNDMIVPLYTVMTPQNTVRATQEGVPIPEEMWNEATPELLKQVASDAAPRVSAVLSGIQADQMNKDPNSLKHRPARVYFSGVKGAPGDGNISLARAFVTYFHNTPDVLQNNPADVDFTVNCHVTLTNAPAGTTSHPQQHIEIVWQVLDKNGKEAGAATQLHDIDAHSLDNYWGDVASAAAQEAAAAVDQILSRYSGRDDAPLPDPASKKKSSDK